MNTIKQILQRHQFKTTQTKRNVFTSACNSAIPINSKPIQNSFYQKPLPKNLTALSSEQGKYYFQNAMVHGFCEAYFNTVGNFSYQSEPAFCGVSSLVMCLNALGIDPLKQWKGIWRWYDEEVVLNEACIPTSYIIKNGITYDQFHCISKRHCKVISKRGHQIDIEEFRNDIKRSCSYQKESLVVNFCRKQLNQTGSGHFSPIGAYDPIEDKVLILEVARFKYPPFFVSLEELYNAMLTLDTTTNKSRGYFLLSKRQMFLDTRFFDCKMKCLNKSI